MLMVQQRTTTAVREGYAEADIDTVRGELASAAAARSWLEGLAIDPAVRATLIEPIAAVEEALSERLRRLAREG
jgi:hypothetical protein